MNTTQTQNNTAEETFAQNNATQGNATVNPAQNETSTFVQNNATQSNATVSPAQNETSTLPQSIQSNKYLKTKDVIDVMRNCFVWVQGQCESLAERLFGESDSYIELCKNPLEIFNNQTKDINEDVYYLGQRMATMDGTVRVGNAVDRAIQLGLPYNEFELRCADVAQNLNIDEQDCVKEIYAAKLAVANTCVVPGITKSAADVFSNPGYGLAFGAVLLHAMPTLGKVAGNVAGRLQDAFANPKTPEEDTQTAGYVHVGANRL